MIADTDLGEVSAHHGPVRKLPSRKGFQRRFGGVLGLETNKDLYIKKKKKKVSHLCTTEDSAAECDTFPTPIVCRLPPLGRGTFMSISFPNLLHSSRMSSQISVVHLLALAASSTSASVTDHRTHPYRAIPLA